MKLVLSLLLTRASGKLDDMLPILFSRAKENNQFVGVVPHLVDGALFILQCADDTVVLMDCSLEHAHNIKLHLTAFEHMHII